VTLANRLSLAPLPATAYLLESHCAKSGKTPYYLSYYRI